MSYSPVRHSSHECDAFDLHVLGTPPAFILSQDQTLHCLFYFRQFLVFLSSFLFLFWRCVFSSLFSFQCTLRLLCVADLYIILRFKYYVNIINELYFECISILSLTNTFVKIFCLKFGKTFIKKLLFLSIFFEYFFIFCLHEKRTKSFVLFVIIAYFLNEYDVS